MATAELFPKYINQGGTNIYDNVLNKNSHEGDYSLFPFVLFPKFDEVPETNDSTLVEDTTEGGTPRRKWLDTHPIIQILGDPSKGVKTRGFHGESALFCCFSSEKEPIGLEEALQDSSWIIVMQEELNQFTRNEV